MDDLGGPPLFLGWHPPCCQEEKECILQDMNRVYAFCAFAFSCFIAQLSFVLKKRLGIRSQKTVNDVYFLINFGFVDIFSSFNLKGLQC